MIPSPEPVVYLSANWDSLSSVQKEAVRTVARATLGWGIRWGGEFKAAFNVRSSTPDELPAGVMMYNRSEGHAPYIPGPGDIVVLLQEGDPGAMLREAARVAGSGALVVSEPHRVIKHRFGDSVATFTSPINLAETIFRFLDDPAELRRIAGMGKLRAEKLVHPFVSIIFFVFNGESYIKEAVESALRQDYDNCEVLVIDDGSTDRTGDIVASITSPRLRYIRQNHGGAPAARNRGIAESKGECVLWAGSDDVLLPGCLSSRVRILSEFPLADVVYGNIMICDSNLTHQRLLRYDEWYMKGALLPAAMVRSNVIPDGGTLVRKECYERIGDYNSDFRRAQDYEWWARLVGNAEFKHDDTTGYLWRWHGSNLGAGSGKTVDMSYESRIVQSLAKRFAPDQLFPELGWNAGPRKRNEAIAHAKLADILVRYGDVSGAIAQLKEGEKAFPLPELRRAIATLSNQTNSSGTQSVPPGDSRVESRELADPVAGRLRITYLITNILGVTGGNQTLLRQANALSDRGHSVAIVTRSEQPAWIDLRAKVLRVGEHEPLWKSVPPSDAVISTYFLNTGELTSVKAPVLVYFAQGDQFVFDDTCVSTRPDVKKLHSRLKELSRMSYLIPGIRFIANSRALARNVESRYGRKADGILPVCVDPWTFRPLAKTPAGSPPRILIVGPDHGGSELEPLEFKGIAEARRALEILVEGGETFSTVRMSSTPPEIFRGFPCEFAVAPSDEGKRRIYGTADILIYASHYDSCPRPPLEAMAAGVAVVCTDTDGAREYCRDGENALLVPIRSPEKIAEAVLRLIHDQEMRRKLVSGGLETARALPEVREWNEMERLLYHYLGREAPRATEPTEAAMRKMAEAERLLRGGDTTKALAASRVAGQIVKSGGADPNLQSAIEVFAGYCLLETGNLESARLSFSLALEINPFSVGACHGIAEVLRRTGHPDQAGTMEEWAERNEVLAEQGEILT